MRVLAVTHSLGTNGAAMCLCQLLVAIKASGGSADVVYEGNEPLAQVLRDHGIGIVQTAQTSQYDVALVNTLVDHARVAELASVLPVVFWVHEGISLLADMGSAPGWVRAFSQSSRIVFQTRWQPEQVFRSFLHATEPHRILTVPPGVAVPAAPPIISLQNGMRSILSIGSVYPRKRPEDLVQAVMRLPQPRPRCLIVGSLEWLPYNNPEMLRTIDANQDVFTLSGEVLDSKKISQYRNESSVFCSASADETFGTAVLEAAIAGLPLAITDLPCYQGIWQHGVNALLSPVGAVDCMSWNLRALLEDSELAKRLAEAAYRTASQYTMDRFLHGMHEALNGAIKNPKH